MDSPTSDTPRQSLLGSINFLTRANRPRAVTTNNSNDTASIPPPAQQPAISNPGHRRRTAAIGVAASGGSTASVPIHTSNTTNTGLGYMLRRRRSATALEAQSVRASGVTDSALSAPAITHRIRLVPHLESNRSLHFDAITRDVRQGDAPLRIGRFTDRSAHSGNSNNKLAFKSKVVSRGHAEIWFDAGTFFIKDTKSSSGTFLNHIRLSSPNTESRPHPVKDGDILQLGVDYQGGTEEIYRCVKMRIELGREWQNGVNAFNSNALLQLKTLSGVIPPKTDGTTTVGSAEKRGKSNLTDCCICLFQVTVCQALFIAPCSHVYHYKCIRPLLEMHHPGFSCPLCRTFADLEADVEIEATLEKELDNSEEHIQDSVQSDVEMAVEEVEEAREADDADADRSLSPRGDLPMEVNVSADDSHSPSVPIPQQRSNEGVFPGAELTPLNNTFLATLARHANNSSGERSGGSSQPLGAIAMSDDGEGEGEVDDDDDDDEGDDQREDAADDANGPPGVGDKRKR